MAETAKKTAAKKTTAKKTTSSHKRSVVEAKAGGFVVHDSTIGEDVSPWFGSEDEANGYLDALEGKSDDD